MAGGRGFAQPPAPARPDPSVATGPAPATSQGGSERRAAISTFFTKVGLTETLYPGDRLWAKVTVTLETAGPVAVGTKQRLTPVLGGAGTLLATNTPTSFTISRGDRLYIAATSVNRVKVVIESFPWLEQLVGLLDRVSRLLGFKPAPRV